MAALLDRSLKVALVVLSTCLCAAPLAQAQSYVFTPIARSTTTPSIGGATCVGMNNSGLVIFRGNALDLWKGDGTNPATPTQVSGAAGSLCASINDLGEIAYLKTHHPVMFVTSLVRNNGGVETILARSDVVPQLDPATTHLPSLNLAGNAVYSTRVGSSPGQGIYIGPGAIKVCDKATDPPDVCAPPSVSMNDSDTAVWFADPGVRGIYRGSLVPLIHEGKNANEGAVNGTMTVGLDFRPVVNNAGTVAFFGRFNPGGVPGPDPGIYTTTDGTSVNLVGTGSFGGGGVSINASGAVAFRRAVASGSGVYVGRPGAIDQKVIGIGDALDGSTVDLVILWEESLNDDGQVAFLAHLHDGRQGVYRGDPQWLGSLSFSQKIPGCGPINGKVKLAAPAPDGGLTIDLVNTNPAADVPPQVVVAKGKTSATFVIDPDAVLVKSDGTITASVAAQSLDRDLTVRPITVRKLTIAPNPVVGGNPATGTVALDCAAPHEITVALSSKAPAVAHPDAPSLLIPAGTETMPFQITSAAVAATKKASIRAAAFGTTKSKTLSVTP